MFFPSIHETDKMNKLSIRVVTAISFRLQGETLIGQKTLGSLLP